ncbi:hypothetical protein ABH892_003669 [Paenibacillus sp. RC254]|uniref:hypothetical protein n=1 Tax=unclassified Paenibacillus TaxID=185978 RepID=UPI0024B8F61E|nr:MULTISPECIES: hypothetical protein [unclassified Paenibacillus]
MSNRSSKYFNRKNQAIFRNLNVRLISDEVIEILQKQHERVFMEKELAGEMYVDIELVCCTNIWKASFPKHNYKADEKKDRIIY